MSAYEDGKRRKSKFAYVSLLVIAIVTIIAVALISSSAKADYHVVCTASNYTIYSTSFTTSNSTVDTTTRLAGVTTYTATTLMSAPPGFVTIRITTQRVISGVVTTGGESTCTYLSR